jgi:Lrp/AsnC family transcriptional regulator, leucine-responsive regulatory protein
MPKYNRNGDLMTTFDRKDFVLLRALQENASRRLEDLSKVVGLAPSSTHERLRRLERLGVIRGWSIEIDPRSLGLDVLAFIGISSKRPCSEIVGALRTIPAVEECHSVAGELSMLLKVRVTDTASLLKLTERVRKIPGIEQTHTTIVLESQFERSIPIPENDPPSKMRR